MGRLLVASLLWSISFALIGASGIDPDVLGAARLGLAAIVFAPFLLVHARRGSKAPPGQREAVSPRQGTAGRLMAIGAVQFGVMYVLVMRSYDYLAGHEVALLTVTTPVLVVLVDGLVARRLLLRAALAACIATAAALAMKEGAARALLGSEVVDRRFLTGLCLVQGANLAWAIGQVVYRRLEGAPVADSAGGSLPPAVRFGWLYVGGFLVSLAWAALHVSAADLSIDRRQVWVILYLGLVPSGVAFYLWNRGATQVSVGVLAVMNNLKVPLAVAVALLPPFSEPFEVGPLARSSALFALALLVAAWPRETRGRAARAA